MLLFAVYFGYLLGLLCVCRFAIGNCVDFVIVLLICFVRIVGFLLVSFGCWLFACGAACDCFVYWLFVLICGGSLLHWWAVVLLVCWFVARLKSFAGFLNCWIA